MAAHLLPASSSVTLPEHKSESVESLEAEMNELKESNASSTHTSYNQFMVEKSRSKAKQTDGELISRMRILCLSPRIYPVSDAKVTVLSSDTSPEAKRFQSLMQSGRVMKYCFLSLHSLQEGWPNISKIHRFRFLPYFGTDKAISDGEAKLGVDFDEIMPHVIRIVHPKPSQREEPTAYGMLSSDAVICSELKHALEERYKDSSAKVTLRFGCHEIFGDLVDDVRGWPTSQRFIEQNFDFVYLGDWMKPMHSRLGPVAKFEQFLQYISLLSSRGVRFYPPVSHVVFASDSWRWGPCLSKFCLPTAFLEMPFDYVSDSKATKNDPTFPKDRFDIPSVMKSQYWRGLTWDDVYDMNLKYLQRAWRKIREKSQGENGCFEPEYLHHHGVRMDPQFPSKSLFHLVFIPPLEESDDDESVNRSSGGRSRVSVYDMKGVDHSDCAPYAYFRLAHGWRVLEDAEVGDEEGDEDSIGRGMTLEEPYVSTRYRVSIGVTVYRKQGASDGLVDKKEDFENDPDGIMPPNHEEESISEEEETDDEGVPEGCVNSRPARMIIRMGQTGSLGALMSIRYKTSTDGKSIREVQSIHKSDPTSRAKKTPGTKTSKATDPVKGKKKSAPMATNPVKGKKKSAPNSLRNCPFKKIENAINSSTRLSMKLVPGLLFETEWVLSTKVKTYPWYEKKEAKFILNKFSLFPAGSDFVVQMIPLSKNKDEYMYLLKWERVTPVVKQIASMIVKYYTEWPR
jgi:hypothetical protein